MTVEAVGLHLDYSKHRIPRRAAHAGHARQARGALRACRLHSVYNMEY
jgi:hypothetical protein